MATEPANAKVHHVLRLATLELLCQKTRHLPPWLKGLEAGQHRQNPLVLCDGPNHYQRFLVDTGAACSVIPQTIAGCGTSSHSNVHGNIFLPTIGGGRLITSGLFSTKLDLGFSRFFSFTFHISSQLDGFLRHWVSLFGCPERIYCDRGRQFTSTVWNDMCVTLGCELHHSSAYHPQAQGLIERFNKTLKTSLKCHEEPSEWYDQLPWTLLALRNMPKEDLDFSTPSDLLFGQSVRLPGEFFEPVSEDAFNINSSSFAQSLSRYMQQIPYFAPRRTNRAYYVDKALMDPSMTHFFIKIDSHCTQSTKVLSESFSATPNISL